MKWIAVEGLAQQWERADVEARVAGDNIDATTKNVTAIRFVGPTRRRPGGEDQDGGCLDGQKLPATWDEKSARKFHREGDKWAVGAAARGAAQKGRASAARSTTLSCRAS